MSFSIPVEDLSRFVLLIHVKDSKILSFELKSSPTPCTSSGSPPSIHLQASGDGSNLDISVSLSSVTGPAASTSDVQIPLATDFPSSSTVQAVSQTHFSDPPYTNAVEEQPRWGLSQDDFANSQFNPQFDDIDWNDFLSTSQLPMDLNANGFNPESLNEQALFADYSLASASGSISNASLPENPSGLSTPSLADSSETSSIVDPLSPPIIPSKETFGETMIMVSDAMNFADSPTSSKPSSPKSRQSQTSQRPRPFPCKHPDCKREFTSTYTREMHMSTHGPKRKQEHPCTMGCGMTFSRKHDRRRHEVSQHGKACDWTCDKCSHFYSSKKMLELHQCCGPIQSRWTSSE